MTHEEKITWMAVWCAKNHCQLELEGEIGFGRECVCICSRGISPDYYWQDKHGNSDLNGEVWSPRDAYHKVDCVAVLGRGEESEAQLYDWLKWFDDNGFTVETGRQEVDPSLGALPYIFSKHLYARMVKKTTASG